MSKTRVISTAVAPIHREPRFSSEMVTQALLWEAVIILDEDNSWYHVQLDDSYTGWIYTFYLSDNSHSFDSWVTLTNRFTSFYPKESPIDESLFLSFGTKLPIIEVQQEKKCIAVELPNKRLGEVSIQKLPLEDKREELIRLAQSLLGTPYVWGGKSAFGFDCSGFVQSVFHSGGIFIARDTSQQIKTSWLNEVPFNDTNPGDLIYFAENGKINHVGMSLGEGKIIHCSGEVKIESMNEGKLGFNPKLHQTIFKSFSISEKV
tara:strand:- start:219 stop:1004 length:786 start_codon:yes stop_codon:yes gene_type:complete